MLRKCNIKLMVCCKNKKLMQSGSYYIFFMPRLAMFCKQRNIGKSGLFQGCHVFFAGAPFLAHEGMVVRAPVFLLNPVPGMKFMTVFYL